MKTLLLIDDDIGPLQFLIDIFEMKYKIVTAESIKIALEKLSDPMLLFDLIISDWHLGDDSTAQEIFKALSDDKYKKYQEIPVIVVSSDEDNKRWIEKHGESFMLKPAHPNELLKLVAEKLDSK